jgi:hypothetical protein
MSARKLFWLTVSSLCCIVLPLAAQEARGTLLGRVTDPSDALVAGARVEATNVDTGIHFNSITNRTGDYIFPLLVPGTYSVKVENPGFKTYTRTGIVVRVNDQMAINVTLEIGQASQTVEVKASASPTAASPSSTDSTRRRRSA